MCEPVTNKIPGWKGWLDVPAPKVSSATGGWFDLSHRLTERPPEQRHSVMQFSAMGRVSCSRCWRLRTGCTSKHLPVQFPGGAAANISGCCSVALIVSSLAFRTGPAITCDGDP